MKIAMITPSFYPQIGGTEVFVENISSKLNRKGVKTDIFTFSYKDSALFSNSGSIEADLSSTVIRIPGFRLPHSKLRTHLLNVNVIPKRRLSDLKGYDILHFHNDSDLSFPLFAYPIRKPKILHCHNIGPNFFYFRINPLSAFILKNVANNYISSTNYASSLLCELGIPKKKINIIPNGVNIEKFSPTPCEREKNLLLFVGRLDPGKGLHFLLRALTLISTPVTLIIAGPRSWNESYNAHILSLIQEASSNTIHKIVYIGEQKPEQLANLYRKATMLILPSLTETFGIVLLEAMASRAPVIASNTGGIPEIVKDKVNGLLFRAGDPIDLAEKISHLLADVNFGAIMGQEGMRQVKEKFTYDTIADNLIIFYEQLLRNRL